VNNKQDTASPKKSLASSSIVTAGRPMHGGDSELTLADLWLNIWRRKLTILFFAAAVLLLVGAYTFLKRPVYESVALIEYDPSSSASLGLDDLLSKTFAANDSDARLQTQVKILDSDTVAIQVIKRLDMGRNPAFAGELAKEITTADPMQMSFKNRDKLIVDFHSSAKVGIVPKSHILRIAFRSTDRKLAADAVNTILDAYLERNFETRYHGTQQVSEWLSTQMQDIKSHALEAHHKLVDFQERHDILGTDQDENIVVDKLRQLNLQLTNAEADRIVKEARYRLAQTGNPELLAVIVPGTLQVLRTQEADLKANLAQVEAKFGPAYPKVRELRSQLARLDGAINAEIKNVGQRLNDEFETAKKSERMVRGQFDAQKEAAFKLNRSAAEFATLKHEVESGQALFDTLELKLNEALVSAGLASANISIVDRGKIPFEAVLPNIPLNLGLGLFVGLFGGFVLAFVRESLDDTINSADQVESWAGLPMLASIPSIRTKSGRVRMLQPGESSSADLVLLKRPESKAAEAYRELRSSLLLSNVDRPPRVVVFISAFPAEGKTITASNCAIALAQCGERVLLVDADLRRSAIHRRFDLGNETGLSTLLAGTSATDIISAPVPELPSLFVLAAGPKPPAPAEMLASRRMRDLLEKWASEYDRVVLDTPPIFLVSDIFSLLTQADAVVVVVRAGVTRKKALQRLNDVMSRIHANVAGVIINDADLNLEHYYTGPYSYRYKNSYYNSYYNDGNGSSEKPKS